MRMFSVASGSSGNCICVGSNNTHILIDAGISKKRIEEGLREKDIDLSDIDTEILTEIIHNNKHKNDIDSKIIERCGYSL